MAGQGTSAAQQVLDAALAKLTQTHGGERQALSGYTQDILGYLKGTPRAIAGDYQGAINQQNGFANQYAAQQRAANPNAGIQGDLAGIRAPQAQKDALRDQNRQAYGGSAANLYALGGAIPNSAFAADKAGALAFARSLPAIEGLRGQQLFAQLLANQGKESTALAGQKADLLYKEQSDAQALAQRRAEQKAAKSPGVDPNYYTDQQGRSVPKGYAYNSRGQLQSLGTVGGATPQGGKGRYRGAYGVLRGLTASQQAKAKMDWRETAINTAHDAFNGTDTDEPTTYQTAMQLLLDHGIPLDIAQNALNRYWRRPGDETNSKEPGQGRPARSYQQRKKKR